MRISSLYIDGFGIFHDESFTALDPGLVLIQGNNETGKSTLLGFIRTILFGFPRANSRDPSFPPVAGGTHGGRIGLVTEGGGEFVIERKPGKSGGLVTVSGPGGNTGDGRLLQQLLGGLTYEVFKNIYAFSLAELQTIDTLRAESIKSVIYGASAGTAMLALPRANKLIKERLESLFRPGGTKPVINRKMTEIDGVRSELRIASKGIAEYDMACKELMGVEEKIQALRHDLIQVNQDRRRFGSYDRLWPQWLALQENETALRELEEVVESFPENGISRLEKALDALHGFEDRLFELNNQQKKLREESEGLAIDEGLLAQAEAIGFLLEKRNEYTEKLKALPMMEQERKALDQEIRALVDMLGKDWTEQRLLAIDRSLFTREAIRKKEDELNRLERELAAADEILADKKVQFNRSAQEEARALKEIEQLGEPEPEADEKIVLKLQHGRDEFAGAIRDLPKREGELQLEKQQLDRIIREIDPTWTEADIDDFDISIAAQKKVEDFDSRLRKAEADLRDAETLRSTIEGSLNKLREKQKAANLKLQGVPQTSASSREDLDQRKSLIQALRRDLQTRSELAREIRHQEERLSDKGEEMSRLSIVARPVPVVTWKRMAGGSAVLGVVGSGWLALSGRLVEAAAWAGILLALAVVFAIASRKLDQQKKSSLGADQSLEDTIKGEMERIEATLQASREGSLELDTKITHHAKHLSGSETITIDDINILENHIERDIRLFDERDRLAEEIQNIEKDKRLSEKDLDDARGRIEQARQHLATIEAEWKGHLQRLKLNQTLTPPLAVAIFSKIETARQQLNSISSLKNRIQEMEGTRDHYLSQAEKIPTLFPVRKGPAADLLAEVDRFFSRLQVHQKQREERNLAEQRLEEKRNLKAEAEKALALTQKAFDKVEKERTEALNNWQTWLISRGLPMDLSPKTALEAFDKINDGFEKMVKRDQIEKTIDSSRRDLARYQEEAARVLGVLGLTMPDAEKLPLVIDGLVSELDDNKGNVHEKKQIDRQIGSIQSQMETVNKQISLCRQQIDALLEEGASKDEKEFLKQGRLFLERNRILQEIAQAERNMRHIAGESDMGVLRDTLHTLTLEEIKSREKELALKAEDIEGELEDLRNKKAELKQRIEMMKSADDIARLRADEERLLAEIQQAAIEWARYAVAKYMIDKAREKFEREQQPRVIRDAGAFFKKITGSRYTELLAPIQEETIEVISSKKERKKPEELSRGTAEQLYLAIRFGYIRNRAKSSEALPVIMDDILVNFDPVRAPQAAEAILELSQEQQVLFFTCHPETVSVFREINARVPLYFLEDGHLKTGE